MRRTLFIVVGLVIYVLGFAVGGVVFYYRGIEQERARYHWGGDAMIRPGREATVLCEPDAELIRVRCEVAP